MIGNKMPGEEEQPRGNIRKDIRDWKSEMKRREFVSARKDGGGKKERERRAKRLAKGG